MNSNGAELDGDPPEVPMDHEGEVSSVVVLPPSNSNGS
jgi:hypothetical protein